MSGRMVARHLATGYLATMRLMHTARAARHSGGGKSCNIIALKKLDQCTDCEVSMVGAVNNIPAPQPFDRLSCKFMTNGKQ